MRTARAQFGFTIAFYVIFRALSLGLVSYLVLEGSSLWTGKQFYHGRRVRPADVLSALLCRVALGAARLHVYVLALPFADRAVAVAVTLFTWLIWFGQ